jgi:hypothetical protein
MEVTMMRTIKMNGRLLITVLCVLVSFIIPVTALAEDEDCPCFTEKDVMRYASHPAKFVCVERGVDQGDRRWLVVGQYAALFSTSADDWPYDISCAAWALVGSHLQNEKAPPVIFLENYQMPISIEEAYACGELIELGDPPDCEE